MTVTTRRHIVCDLIRQKCTIICLPNLDTKVIEYGGVISYNKRLVDNGDFVQLTTNDNQVHYIHII